MAEIKTVMEPIPQGMTRGWQVLINGQPYDGKVETLQVTNSRYGLLTYGKNPAGMYDSWAFHEIGGGGAVIVPFILIQGEIWIGVVQQIRLFQSGTPVLNVPRGFLDPNEKHFEAAVRETEEETGFSQGSRVFQLPGEPLNPNSAFFETWGDGEGVKFFAVEILQSEIEPGEGDTYVFKPGVLNPVNKTAEGILKSVFIPWRKAALLGDSFTRCGVVALLAQIG